VYKDKITGAEQAPVTAQTPLVTGASNTQKEPAQLPAPLPTVPAPLQRGTGATNAPPRTGAGASTPLLPTWLVLIIPWWKHLSTAEDVKSQLEVKSSQSSQTEVNQVPTEFNELVNLMIEHCLKPNPNAEKWNEVKLSLFKVKPEVESWDTSYVGRAWGVAKAHFKPLKPQGKPLLCRITVMFSEPPILFRSGFVRGWLLTL